ncbi:MAG TPA: Gfo/Idh/MocA family oxidoreductase [Kofleriaceae bacterium]|nr:Gfo/Idh/MocA family oxidoreductase [Kofleriaceae bacterium]
MVRVAVIGAGAWGINHVRVLAREPRCALVGVADPDPRARERAAAAAPGAACVADPDELLARPDVDAVVLATPAPTHARLAIAAFEQRKHVLIEKPLALDLGDALQVADAGARSGRVGMVGHVMLYHPAVVKLRSMLSSGSLGALHYLFSTRVNLGRLRGDESALWSFGPHDLSMIDFLVEQEPETVAARGASVLQRGIEDVVFLTLRFATGMLAHVHLSWLNPRKERRLTLVCSQKMVEFDDVTQDKLRIYDRGYDRPPEFSDFARYLTLRDGDVFIPKVPMDEPLRLELASFLDCIEARTQPVSDLAHGVRVIRTLAAAQRSLAGDGVPVTMNSAGRRGD